MAFDGTLWGRRVQLTGITPVATATGFVGLITVDNIPSEAMDGGLLSALNGGGDLRVSTDNAGANQLPLEVVSFVVSGTTSLRQAQLWVRFPSYESANRSLWLFYNRVGQTQPPVTDPFGRNSVWQGYAAVWHGQSVLSSIADSSGNQLDGVAVGNVSNGSGVFLNESFSFDGTSGSIDFGDLTNAPGGSNTSAMIQASVRLSSSPTTNQSIIGGRNTVSTPWMMADNSFSGDSNTVVTAPNGRNSRQSNGNNSAVVDNSLLIHSLWANGSAGGEPLDGYESYINGQQTSSVSGVSGFVNSFVGFQIGGEVDFASVPIIGEIEEVRIYSGYKDAGHITLEYSNFSSPSTFWTTGTPEDTGGSSGITLTIDSGSFSVAGNELSLKASFNTGSQEGVYTLIGSATGLSSQRKTTLEQGGFTLTGSQLNVLAAYREIAESGSYDLTGSDVTLIYTPSTSGEIIIVESGAFSLTGVDIGLIGQFSTLAETGEYSLIGGEVPLRLGTSLQVEAGSYSIGGNNLGLIASYGIISSTGNYSLEGKQVTLRYSGDTAQTIGVVTSSYADSGISIGYKPDQITVTFKGL